MAETSRRQTLRKHERLHDKRVMEMTFEKGNSIHNSPIKLLWIVEEKKSDIPTPKISTPIKVAFTVPKKRFKKAVTRNLLKRRMREAYRKNKISTTKADSSYTLVFIYTSHKINPYAEIASKIVLTLQHFKTATGAE